MSDSIAAPTGADVSGASSSAPQPASTTTTTVPSTSQPSTKPRSAGRPSASEITRSLAEKKAEKAKTEPASTVDAKAQPDGALGADVAGKKPEGETANLPAGEGEDKPKEKRDSDLPPWLKERLGKEKDRREKLETGLTAAKAEAAKMRHLAEVAIKESQRYREMLEKGTALDPKSEEIAELKLEQAMKAQFASLEQQHQKALSDARYEMAVKQKADELVSEAQSACQEFPLVSYAEVKAMLRENPHANIRDLAQARHQERMAFIAKQGGQAAVQQAPTTVAKPSGVSRSAPPLNAKGMASAFSAARAKG
jgi:hypothetical protein